ncbi:pyridoxamine 5'-phosphate oxidase family protein [Pseudoramibacter alactolyticus]|uniref:pyridoxamine 5'-phosphate oxidase family protein n=1 Tax=Pseudoramibacter alactolyticus TaxID=113287 RepID=UPI0036F3A0C4
MADLKQVEQFLNDAGVYFLATLDGDQSRVRPFGTAHLFEGRLYIQTGKVKAVSRQLHANPKAELCAFKDGRWLRVAATLVPDERRAAKAAMLDAYPDLKAMYSADDDNTEVFYLKAAKATFCSFTAAPETVTF